MVRTAVGLVCLVAACGGTKATVATKAPDTFEGSDAPRRDPFVAAESAAIYLTAADAKYLYWIDDAGLKRRPHGPDQKAELVTDSMATYTSGAMLVVGDRAYVFEDLECVSVSLATKDADPEPIATLTTHINAFSVDANGGVVVASEGQIVEVAAGKQPRVLASGQGSIIDVVVDADHAYFAVDGNAAPADPNTGAPAPSPYYTSYDLPHNGAIKKVSRRGGGSVDVLVAGVAVPHALHVHEGRVWWASEDPAVKSVPVGGGEVKDEAPGRGSSVAVDAAGMLYQHMNGALFERRGDTFHLVFTPDGTWSYPTGFVLSPEWAYVSATRPDSGLPGIVAVPRQPSPVTVAFALDRSIQRMVAEDGALYWIEATRDNDGHAHIMRGDPETGTKKELADHEGWVAEMTVGGGQVYFTDQYSIWQVSTGGGGIKTFNSNESWITGLNVHRNHLYWFDGSRLFARKRKGGPSFAIASYENYGYGSGYGYGYGDGGGDLVFDDDFVYTTGFGQGGNGVYQISERGQVKLLWDGSNQSYPGKDLIMFGDELFFAAQSYNGGSWTVYRLTLDGEATPIYTSRGDYGADLAAGGGMLYLLTPASYYYELARIDPSNGEAQIVLRVSYEGDYPSLVADDRAVFLATEWFDAILRISHAAPPVLEPGWASRSE